MNMLACKLCNFCMLKTEEKQRSDVVDLQSVSGAI